MCQLLISLGADVNRLGIRSISAIQQALIHRYVFFSPVLFFSSLFFISLAYLLRNEKLVQLLVEKGAELNMTYDSGWTLLHLALSRNLGASAKLLLSKGINGMIRHLISLIVSFVRKKSLFFISVLLIRRFSYCRCCGD
jgi:ankyrin repeat protein